MEKIKKGVFFLVDEKQLWTNSDVSEPSLSDVRITGHMESGWIHNWLTRIL